VLIVIGSVYGILVADSVIYSAAVTEYGPAGELGSAQAAQAFIGFLASAVSPVAAGLVLDLGRRLRRGIRPRWSRQHR
jgi:hypothetical protein